MSIAVPGHGGLKRSELGMSTHLKSRPARLGAFLAPSAVLLLLAASAAQAAVVVGGRSSPRALGAGATVSTAGMAITAAAVALVALTAAYVAVSGWIDQGRVEQAAVSFVVPGEPVQLPVQLPSSSREFESERDRRAA
jgi:hypothetical protein